MDIGICSSRRPAWCNVRAEPPVVNPNVLGRTHASRVWLRGRGSSPALSGSLIPQLFRPQPALEVEASHVALASGCGHPQLHQSALRNYRPHTEHTSLADRTPSKTQLRQPGAFTRGHLPGKSIEIEICFAWSLDHELQPRQRSAAVCSCLLNCYW